MIDFVWCSKLLLDITYQWLGGKDTELPIQEPRFQNYSVAPSSTEPFILPRKIIWVPGTPGDLMLKRKLSPRSDYAAVRQLSPIHKIRFIKFFFFYSKLSPTPSSSCLKLVLNLIKNLFRSWPGTVPRMICLLAIQQNFERCSERTFEGFWPLFLWLFHSWLCDLLAGHFYIYRRSNSCENL